MLKPLTSHYSGLPSFSWLKIDFYDDCLKFQNMEGNSFAPNPHEIVLEGKYKVRREEGVYPAVYPCSQFMEFAGITQDFHTLLSNAGLEHFLENLPYQYAILSMSVVQNFIAI